MKNLNLFLPSRYPSIDIFPLIYATDHGFCTVPPREEARPAEAAAADRGVVIPKLCPELWTRINSFLKTPAIAAGLNHTVVLREDGQVYTFGSGEHGQLGNGRNVTCNTPQPITIPSRDGAPLKVKAIATTFDHTIVLGEDGQVYTFGSGEYGQLGNGRYDDYNTPQIVQVED